METPSKILRRIRESEAAAMELPSLPSIEAWKDENDFTEVRDTDDEEDQDYYTSRSLEIENLNSPESSSSKLPPPTPVSSAPTPRPLGSSIRGNVPFTPVPASFHQKKYQSTPYAKASPTYSDDTPYSSTPVTNVHSSLRTISTIRPSTGSSSRFGRSTRESDESIDEASFDSIAKGKTPSEGSRGSAEIISDQSENHSTGIAEGGDESQRLNSIREASFELDEGEQDEQDVRRGIRWGSAEVEDQIVPLNDASMGSDDVNTPAKKNFIDLSRRRSRSSSISKARAPSFGHSPGSVSSISTASTPKDRSRSPQQSIELSIVQPDEDDEGQNSIEETSLSQITQPALSPVKDSFVSMPSTPGTALHNDMSRSLSDSMAPTPVPATHDITTSSRPRESASFYTPLGKDDGERRKSMFLASLVNSSSSHRPSRVSRTPGPRRSSVGAPSPLSTSQTAAAPDESFATVSSNDLTTFAKAANTSMPTDLQDGALSTPFNGVKLSRHVHEINRQQAAEIKLLESKVYDDALEIEELRARLDEFEAQEVEGSDVAAVSTSAPTPRKLPEQVALPESPTSGATLWEELQQKEKKIQRLEEEADRIEKEVVGVLEKAGEKLEEAESALEKVKEEKASAEAQLRQVQAREAEREAEWTAEREKLIEQLSTAAVAGLDEGTAQQSKVLLAEINRLNAEVRASQKTSSDPASELESVQSALSPSQSELSIAQATLAELHETHRVFVEKAQAEIAHLESANKAFVDMEVQWENELDSLEAEVKSLKENNERLELVKEGLDSKVETAMEKTRAVEEELEASNKVINNLQSQIGTLEAEQASFQKRFLAQVSEMETIKSNVHLKSDRILELENKLTKVQEEHNVKAVELAKKDGDEALMEHVQLKEKFSQAEERNKFLQSEVRSLELSVNQLRAHLADQVTEIETINQNLRAKSEKVFHLETELDHIKIVKSTWESDADATRRKHTRLVLDKEAAEALMEKAKKETRALRSELNSISASHSSLQAQQESKITSLTAKLQVSESEISSFEETIARHAAEKAAVGRTVSQLETELARLRSVGHDLGSSLEKIKVQRNSSSSAKGVAVKEVEELKKRLRQMEKKEKKRSESKVRDLEDELLQKREELREAFKDLDRHVSPEETNAMVAQLKLTHNRESKGLLVRIRYLKALFTRENRLRMDLAFQKKYLLTLLGGMSNSEREAMVALAQLGYSPSAPPRKCRTFKGVALAVLMIVRTRRQAEDWARECQVKAQLKEAHREARSRS